MSMEASQSAQAASKGSGEPRPPSPGGDGATINRMHILHVIASVDPATGGPIEGILRQEEVTRDVFHFSSREIVSLDPPAAPYLQDFPLKVHAVGRPRRRGGPLRRFLDHYRYAPDFRPWLKENAGRFDVVFVHGLWNYASAGASRVLPRTGVPYFAFTHGMMDPWFKRTYPLKHLAKRVFWRFAEGPLLAGATSVLFTCEEERRLARTSFAGFPYRETVVGYGAAEPPPVTPDDAALVDAAVPGLAGRRYILFLSRIHRKKGCDDLLAGFARAAGLDPDIQLVVAGPDTTGLRPSLEAQARSLGVADRVFWPGPLYGRTKWAALRQAEAFALPSHQENFGIAVAEALGCGTPVLISRQVNIWREIAEGGAGIVDADDAGGVERMMRRWMTTPAGDRTRMATDARNLFLDKFSVQKTAPELLRTVSRLASLPYL